MRVAVRAATAVEGDLPTIVHAIATVVSQPGRPGAVVTPVAGIVVEALAVEGTRVAPAAPLFRLDDRPFREALAKAKAVLRTAQAELDRAQTFSLEADVAELERAAAEARALVAPAQAEFDRIAGLRKEGLSTEKAETEARLAWQAASRSAIALEAKARLFREKGRSVEVAKLEATVEEAKADLPAAERALAATLIVAPVGGRVARVLAAPGRLAEAGALLAEIVADDDVVLRLSLAPADAAALLPKAAVAVEGSDLRAEVSGIGTALDADTGLATVLARFSASPEGLRLGETLLVTVERGAPVHGILVPAAAVELRDDVARVMTLDGEGIAHAVPVTVLSRSSDLVAVKAEGLGAGARVIIEGNVNLPDGARTVPFGAKAPPEKAPPGGPGGEGR